jgi:tetratricopeptide (TPR) repeat protein
LAGKADDKAAQAPLPQGLGPVRQRLELASVPAKQARLAELGDSSVGRELRRADELGARARSPAELERARAAFGDVLAASANLGWSEPRLSPLQQDMLQRLAEAALRQGQPQQALEWAQQGLDLDGPPSPLLGLLWLTLGEAHEALGDRAAAARSYLKALSIYEALLKETLSP